MSTGRRGSSWRRRWSCWRTSRGTRACRPTAYTQLLEEARRHAVDRLVTNATAMGANAVVMMRFDSAEIGQTMSEIVAYGTAVVMEPVSA
ncbi:MAG TPA: heavy metal-binding domain-containing protein [Reyranella sp.]